MTKPAEEFMELAAEISMEWFNIEPVAQALQAEYQRGVTEGKAAVAVDPDQLKAEFERGRESYRNELLVELQSRHNLPPASPKPPPAATIEDVAVSKSPVQKNVGGAPSKSGRPDTIPTNQAMAIEAIKELGGKASAPQIREYCRKKYWPGMPDHWTACIWDMKDRLGRDGINFVLIEDAKPPAPKPPKPEPQAVINREVAKRVEPPKPRAPAPVVAPRPQAAIPFKHGDKSVSLVTARDYSIASRLQKTMGKGHVSEAYLAEVVIGSNTEHNRMMVKDLCLAMNPALLSIGLKIEHYPGFGLMMKDVG